MRGPARAPAFVTNAAEGVLSLPHNGVVGRPHMGRPPKPRPRKLYSLSIGRSMLLRRRFLSGLCAVPLTKVSFAQGTPASARAALDVRDFVRAADGAPKDTAAIQRALDRCD